MSHSFEAAMLLITKKKNGLIDWMTGILKNLPL